MSPNVGVDGHAEWFKARLVAPATWAIDDHGQDTVYLVAGAERCLLVDTGWGVGDLASLVASLSSLPLLVVNSHGHPDHACGNGQFREVHVGEADAWLVRDPLTEESRRWIAGNVLKGPLPPSFSPETWATKAAETLVPIRDGHTFDLGGRTLQAIAVPGHTAGSLCLLDREARYLLTGDSALAGPVWMHLEESVPLRQFHASLRRLLDIAEEFDWILPAHGPSPLPSKTLDELVAGVESILDGRLVGSPHKTFAGDGLRCDFGSCGIVYRPDRLG